MSLTKCVRLVSDIIIHKMEKGEINLESKEALKSILKEYKTHVSIIEQELDTCKKEHDALRLEMTELVEENRELYQKLKSRSESALYNCEKPSLLDSSDAVDNVQQQLALALGEKETIEKLWKSTLKEADGLKEQLEEHQSGKQLSMTRNKLNEVQRDYTEAIKILESRLAVLKSEHDRVTAKAQVLEKQLTHTTSQMALVSEKNLTLSNSLKEVTSKEQEWKSRYLELEAKFIELDRRYQADKVKFAHTYEYEKVEAHLKEKLEGALKQRDQLQSALERCHERIAETMRNASSDRERIEEAVALVDEVTQSRDEALAREAAAAEELKRLKMEMSGLVEEAGLRVGQEVAAVRRQFEDQLTALRDQLQVVEQERTRRCVEVQQLQKECERLQTLLDRGVGAGVAERRDKQLEKMYQELHCTDTECLQLRVENEALQERVISLQSRCRKKSRDKMKLQHKLACSEQECQLVQHELSMMVQKAELLMAQLNKTSLEQAQMQGELINQRDTLCKSQAKISLANSLELYKKLDDSYEQMNNKWRKEMNTLTESFEARLKKLKAKNKIRKEETYKKKEN